jgi:hypothetical protein
MALPIYCQQGKAVPTIIFLISLMWQLKKLIEVEVLKGFYIPGLEEINRVCRISNWLIENLGVVTYG